MNSRPQVIQDVEWLFTDLYTPEVLSGICTNRIFQIVKKLDKLPLKLVDIAFSDDEWNFTEATLRRVPQRKSIYKFADISDNYKEEIKFFTLSILWQGNYKIQSLYTKLGRIKKFINFLTSQHIYSLDYVSLNTIKIFINENSHLEPQTIADYKYFIKLLFEFHSQNYNQLELSSIYKYLSEYDSASCSAQRQTNKWPTIQDDYYNRLLSCLVKVMDDEGASIDDRGIAAEVVLLSQTGLRQGELTDCTINSLNSTSILSNTKTAYYLKYYTTKNVRGDGNKRQVYTMITELAFKAYTVLNTIYDQRRTELNTDLLFVPLKAKTLPVTENTISRMLTALLLKYGEEVGCINVAEKYPDLHIQSLEPLIKRKATIQDVLCQYKPTDTLSIPRCHQFRVYLCNKLYEQGVPLLYIQQHMNHLSSEMSTYYIRPKKDIKKEQEYAESIMRMIVKGEANILGETSNELLQQINKFIKDSKLNVEKDLDVIISKLVKKMPVRAKSGGICIKSGPIRDCSKNEISDEIFCSYGMCPNNFHVYYMVDISYDKYTTLLKTINYNKENKFFKAAEKETNKLKWIVEKHIIPELEELKEEIDKKGADQLKTLHPQIKWHIDNVNIIYEEVVKWTK